MKSSLRPHHLVFLTAAFTLLCSNGPFLTNLLAAYPPTLLNLLFIGSVLLILFLVMVILLLLLTLPPLDKVLRPLLVGWLLVAAGAHYFMAQYHVLISPEMIHNILQTNLAEATDLLHYRLFWEILVLAILPAIFIFRVNLKKADSAIATISIRLKIIAGSLMTIAILLVGFNKYYASFFREHKIIRYYTNPTYPLYAFGAALHQAFFQSPQSITPIANDAHIDPADHHRELIIVVLGETARADRFSLNGHLRETNPLLKQESQLFSFANVLACGTSTAISVPCLFSHFSRPDFSIDKAKATENVLDVLVKTKQVNVLWRDNNSSSKGVADRIRYEDFKTAKNNPICDEECRDEGMLVGLQEYIDQTPKGDILIVLHQMGSHGPAYFKRYPPQFEKFKPSCHTNQLEACTQAEIDNAYDNTILYTDYFLAKTIQLLKQNGQKFEAGMLYIGDHGESLGENKVFLHGFPYFMAPKAQIHVPCLVWLSQRLLDDVNPKIVQQNLKRPYSHANFFHTLLGLFEVESHIYQRSMDMLH